MISTLLQKIKKVFSKKEEVAQPQLLPVFENYYEAEKNATYNNEDIIKIVSAKTKRIQALSLDELSGHIPFRVLFAVLNIYKEKKTKIRVLEIGGACGAAYHIMSFFISDIIEEWIILETQKMVDEARKVNVHPNLKFVSDFNTIDSSKQFDLIIAVGALQYVPDMGEFIVTLSKLNALNIFLSRQVFSLNADHIIYSIQETQLLNHGTGENPLIGLENKTTYQPITYMPLQLCMKKMEQCGYRLIFKADESEASNIALQNISLNIQDFTILFDKK